MKSIQTIIFLLIFSACKLVSQSASTVTVYYNSESMPVQFAVGDIREALDDQDITCQVQPVGAIKSPGKENYNIILLNAGNNAHSGPIRKSGIKNIGDLKNEGFSILKNGKNATTIWIIGADEAGAMYGGLEAAEIIRTRGLDGIEDQIQNPYMKVRGTKFNIPLDVRTPSYSDVSDAAQHNMAEMWNLDFWKDYIDNLARYRYNTISIWSLHPFPSMVKVPEYPDIALDDVHQSTSDWKENYSLNAHGFDDLEIVDNYRVIKKISIKEKMDFWREVMAYGKQRNVQFFVLTWNIFDYGTKGKYGITDKLENEVTRVYFRKSVKQMILEYPDLAGIGLTTGENMYNYTPTQKEEWAFETYGRGVLEALAEQPGRKINFIHRQHQTQAKEISSIFGEVIDHPDINFIFSFKYAKAHVYSSVNQVYHTEFVKDIQSAGDLKTMWTLRNDDIFHFRWGAPDFVRDFIKNIPYDVSEGYYYGSDQWVWGREFLGKYADNPRELEVEKHWYQWMLWGRLGFNPELGNDRFTDIIHDRFPEVDAKSMFDAWQSASMIYPLVTGFHWGQLDFQWYIESGQSQPDPARTPSGYHDVNRFITLPPHKGTGYMSVPDYVYATLEEKEINKITPIQVAETIEHKSDAALHWANQQEPGSNNELQVTLDDIRTMAWLGKYYSHKIVAATHLAMFRETWQPELMENVIKELNLSAGCWRTYASIALSNYHNPLWTNRVGYVDWRENYKMALYDITVHGGQINVSSMDPTEGGTILEAEDASFGQSFVSNEIGGYTGEGYLATREGHARHQVEWTYVAPEAGTYTLEFRYSLKREQSFPSEIMINGANGGNIRFWMTGRPGCWAWDRVKVNLVKGANTIKISPEGFVLLDHLNVMKN